MPRTPEEEERGALPERWVAELDQLAAKMQPFGLHLTEKRKERIRRYCELVLSWNRRQSLVSQRDIVSLVQKHVGASLGALLVASPNQRERWIDVGTGAGLPGLVLKAWEPAQEIALIEASRKKGVFLSEVVRALGVGSVRVHIDRAERLVADGNLLGAFDVLFARAVAELKTTLRVFGPLVRSGGAIVTFKGPSWRGDFEEAEADGLFKDGFYGLEQVVCVPWAPAHLLLVRKGCGTKNGDGDA